MNGDMLWAVTVSGIAGCVILISFVCACFSTYAPSSDTAHERTIGGQRYLIIKLAIEEGSEEYVPGSEWIVSVRKDKSANGNASD